MGNGHIFFEMYLYERERADEETRDENYAQTDRKGRMLM